MMMVHLEVLGDGREQGHWQEQGALGVDREQLLQLHMVQPESSHPV